MREHQLLSPNRQPDARTTNPHDGSIVAETPNQLWGTDATTTFTEQDGQVTIFAAIDHCTAITSAFTRAPFRGARADPASGSGAVRFFLRQRSGRRAAPTRSRQCLDERRFPGRGRFLGMESSPAFVRQPEGNGGIERFFRTLKEHASYLPQPTCPSRPEQYADKFPVVVGGAYRDLLDRTPRQLRRRAKQAALEDSPPAFRAPQCARTTRGFRLSP